MKFHTCDMRFEMAIRLDPRGKLFSEKEFCLTSRTVRSRDTTSGGILGAQRVPGRRVEGKGRCVLGRARRGAAAHARALGATRWLTTCVRVVLAGAAPRPRHHRPAARRCVRGCVCAAASAHREQRSRRHEPQHGARGDAAQYVATPSPARAPGAAPPRATLHPGGVAPARARRPARAPCTPPPD